MPSVTRAARARCSSCPSGPDAPVPRPVPAELRALRPHVPDGLAAAGGDHAGARAGHATRWPAEFEHEESPKDYVSPELDRAAGEAAAEAACHPEQSEGGHARYGPLHCVQGDTARFTRESLAPHLRVHPPDHRPQAVGGQGAGDGEHPVAELHRHGLVDRRRRARLRSPRGCRRRRAMPRRDSSCETSAAGPSMVRMTCPDESCWATTITGRLPCSPFWTCTCITGRPSMCGTRAPASAFAPSQDIVRHIPFELAGRGRSRAVPAASARARAPGRAPTAQLRVRGSSPRGPSAAPAAAAGGRAVGSGAPASPRAGRSTAAARRPVSAGRVRRAGGRRDGGRSDRGAAVVSRGRNRVTPCRSGDRRSELARPAEADGGHQARGPGAQLAAGAALVSPRRRPAPRKRLEGGRQPPRGREAGEQRRGAIPERGNAVARGLAGRAAGEVALDLDALRPAQPLVQIGVQLVFRNVPHWSPFVGSAAGRARPPGAAAPVPGSCPPPHRQSRLGGDLRIAQARVPEQEDLAVPRRQRVERLLHRRHLLVVLDACRPPPASSSAGRSDRL